MKHVRILKRTHLLNPGEQAGFDDETAAALVESGHAEYFDFKPTQKLSKKEQAAEEARLAAIKEAEEKAEAERQAVIKAAEEEAQRAEEARLAAEKAAAEQAAGKGGK